MSSPALARARARTGDVDPPARASLTSPLRQAGYAAILTALCFIQDPGRMVADTKFDLLTDPWHFLARGMQLWDPSQSFGQIPDQSYGYVWPMGPFFWLGDLIQLPPWVTQRLWWALLLCLAFFGMLRLLDRLSVGTELTRVAAAFAFVFTPRITTLMGLVSVEIWPMALAPWVLLPLVRGSRTGSVRRAAALSALAVASAGGVNAVAVAAVLPLGVIWIVTRSPGPRRWPLLGWWTALTIAATLWWSGPLLLMGRYSPPFLDYIENANITTLPTDLTRSLLGLSDWVAYFSGHEFQAGLHVVGTPYLVIDAALIAALGLAGMGLRGAPERRFLIIGLLAGLLLVGMGYAGDLGGFFAEDRRRWLDLGLAPLRNVHKFDVVLRIPLIIGLAHALTELPKLLQGSGSIIATRVFRVATVLALVALASPWLYTLIPAQDGVEAVPDYWQQTADYLAEHDDGSVALELPASSFGIYQWGNVHDDVLQGLARSPWAVRSVVPLAQPGNVVFLDAVTTVVESGRPSSTLAPYLAANGVGTLVVRNDLDRVLTGAPDPAYVRAVLAESPGIELVKSFGPWVGTAAYTHAADEKHTRLVTGSGVSAITRSIDIYRVTDPQTVTLSESGQILVGDPGSPLDLGMAAVPMVPRSLAADHDDRRAGPVTGQVLTDDLKRREVNFPAVRWNRSATMTAGDHYRLSGKEQSHRLVDDDRRWNTVVTWRGGVDQVTASSSQAYADATPPLAVGSAPGAVFDHDRATSWESARDADPDGQWWQADFSRPRTVGRVAVALSRDSVPLRSLKISGGGQSRVVRAPKPGSALTYSVGLPTTDSLRIAAVYDGPLLTGTVAFSEVGIDDLMPRRFLRLPQPEATSPVDVVALSRDPGRFPCVQVESAFTCDPLLGAPGEDGDTLAREFTLPRSVGDDSGYTAEAMASLRRKGASWRTLLHGTGVRIRTVPHGFGDPARRPGAMVDGDPSTTWIAHGSRSTIKLRLPHPTRVSRIAVTLNPGAPASAPDRILVRTGDHQRVVDLGADGRARLPGWRTQHLEISVESTRPAFSAQGTGYVELPPGVTELKINGRPLTHAVFGTVVVPCGKGPRIDIGGTIFDTTLQANARTLLRGTSVPLQLCGTDRVRLGGAEQVIGAPTEAVRVDSLTLTRPGADLGAASSLGVDRDEDGVPTAVQVPARDVDSVATLPQNINAGWRATLAGRQLDAQRMDGWKQGWVVPPGAAGTMRLHFIPARSFDLLLILGALLFAGVVVAASPLSLRRFGLRWNAQEEPPPLQPGASRSTDIVVVTAAAALLAGWLGLALLGGAVLVARRFPGFRAWSLVSAVALMTAGAGLTWGPLKGEGWGADWAQVWAMAAVACLSVSLLARTPVDRHESREAPDASSTRRS